MDGLDLYCSAGVVEHFYEDEDAGGVGLDVALSRELGSAGADDLVVD